MNTPKALLSVFVLLVLALTAWLIFSDPGVEEGTAEVTADTMHALPPESEEVEAQAQTIERERKSQKRLLRVIDPNEKPVVGAVVYCQFFEDEKLYKGFSKGTEYLDRIREEGNFEHFTLGEEIVTDKDGYAKLPDAGFGFVYANIGWASNVEQVGKPEPNQDQIVLLKLLGFPSLEVHVINADGSPAPGHRVTLAYSQKGNEKDRVFPRPGRPRFRSSPPTNSNGNTFVRFDLAEQFALHEWKVKDYDFFLEIRHGFVRPIRKHVYPNQKGPVVIQLPSGGGIEVTLLNGVEHLFPTLYTLDENGRPNYRENLEPDNINGDRGKWMFSHAPLGKSFHIQLSLGEKTKTGIWSSSTQSSGHDFAGPTTEGEVVKTTMDLADNAWLTGRLFDSENKPLAIKRGHRELEFRAMANEVGQAALELEVLIGTDGRFMVMKPRQARLVNFNKDLTTLAIQRTQQVHDLSPEAEPAPPPISALVPIPVPPNQGPAELGDIQLVEAKPLLTVTAINTSGFPIERPTLSVSFETKNKTPGPLPTYWKIIESSVSSGWDHWPSRRDGTVRAYGPSWMALANSMDLYDDKPKHSQFKEIKVNVRAHGYLPAEEIIPVSQKELTITLKTAGEVVGSVIRSPMFRRLKVMALGPGEMIDHSPSGRQNRFPIQDGIRHDDGTGPKTAEYKISNLRPGTYDIVFTASNEGEEIYRVSNVEVGEGECKDSRLQNVDLIPHLGFIQIRVFDEHGAILSQGQLSKLRGSVSRSNSNWTGGGGSGWVVHDGFIWVELAKGSQIHAVAQIPGRSELRMDGWGPCTYDWHPRDLQSINLTITNANDLPRGTFPGVMLTSNSDSASWKLDGGSRSNASWNGKIPGPGNYLLKIYSRRLPHLFVADLPLQILPQDLEANAAIEITLTQEQLDAFKE